MFKGFLLNLFWEITGKPTRYEAERMARIRLMIKEFPSFETEKRIKERWKNAERKKFRIVK